VLLGLTQASAQQTLYLWVDAEGLVHYGDHVPPIYADQDREILIGHGVAVRLVEGTATEAELALQPWTRPQQRQSKRERTTTACC
jgi:hypothetical protein